MAEPDEVRALWESPAAALMRDPSEPPATRSCQGSGNGLVQLSSEPKIPSFGGLQTDIDACRLEGGTTREGSLRSIGSAIADQLVLAQKALAERHEKVCEFIEERLQASNLNGMEAVDVHVESTRLRSKTSAKTNVQASLVSISTTTAEWEQTHNTEFKESPEPPNPGSPHPLPPSFAPKELMLGSPPSSPKPRTSTPSADGADSASICEFGRNLDEGLPGMIATGSIDKRPVSEELAFSARGSPARVTFRHDLEEKHSPPEPDELNDSSRLRRTASMTSAFSKVSAVLTRTLSSNFSSNDREKNDTMKRCENCAASMSDDSVICGKCGNRRSSKPTSKGASHPNSEDTSEDADGHPVPFRFRVLKVWKDEHYGNGCSDLTQTLAKKMMKRLKTDRQLCMAKSFHTVDLEAMFKKPDARHPDALHQQDWLIKYGHGQLSKFIIHPYSPHRAAWDLMSLFLVLYDTIMIPLHFFDLPESAVIDLGDWTTRLFWTFDIGLSLFTGFVGLDGSIDLRPDKIVRRYVRTWFVLDSCIVGVDWLEVFVQSTSESVGFARLGKTSRIFRVVRMVRLLRVMRMKEVLAFITERINSEKILIAAHIMKLLVFVVMMSHLLGCIWYGVGVQDKSASNSWVNHHGYGGSTPLGDKYLMSLHWAMAQFAGGMDEITPENALERLYAIFVFLMAFTTAAFVVSSLTSSMTQLQILGSGQLQMQSSLRQFLLQHKIPNKLSQRIQRNALHSFKEQQRQTPEEDVNMLAFVSEPLRMELHFQMCQPVFGQHPFFKVYMEEYPQVMRKVCHEATSQLRFCSGDIIFNAGELPSTPKMYFLVEGILEYVYANKERAIVKSGEWVSEAVLWTHWMYRGDLTAVSNASLKLLDAKVFQDIASQFSHHENDVNPRAYAKEFVKRLNRNALGISDLSDRSEEKVVRRSSTIYGEGSDSWPSQDCPELSPDNSHSTDGSWPSLSGKDDEPNSQESGNVSEQR